MQNRQESEATMPAEALVKSEAIQLRLRDGYVDVCDCDGLSSEALH